MIMASMLRSLICARLRGLYGASAHFESTESLNYNSPQSHSTSTLQGLARLASHLVLTTLHWLLAIGRLFIDLVRRTANVFSDSISSSIDSMFVEAGATSAASDNDRTPAFVGGKRSNMSRARFEAEITSHPINVSEFYYHDEKDEGNSARGEACAAIVAASARAAKAAASNPDARGQNHNGVSTGRHGKGNKRCVS